LTRPAPGEGNARGGAAGSGEPGATGGLGSGGLGTGGLGTDGPGTGGLGIGGLPLLWRASLRRMRRQPGQMTLAVVGVALGVAVVVAVDLASRSAGRAFELSTEAVTGRATHQVVGGPERLPESLFPRLVLATGVAAAPVVEDYVTLPARPGRPARLLHLFGIDPFSEGPLRPYLAASGTGLVGTSRAAGLAPLLLRSGTCLLSAATAAELGLRAGDRFTVRAGGLPQSPRTLELAGVIQLSGAGAHGGGDEGTASGARTSGAGGTETSGAGGTRGAMGGAAESSAALADLLVMDVAAAQELLGRPGRLDRIDLRLGPEGGQAGPEGPARIAALLSPGAQLLPAPGHGRDTLAMTRAFRVNLTALSLLALLCGAFLIYNTMTFSVVQRRPLLGTLRALGVTRGQVLALVMGEAAAVAAAGTGAGLLAGVLLGRGLLRLVTQTINDLYFAVSVRDLDLSPASFLTGAAIGIGATLTAALAPALEAALTPPRAVLSRSLLEARLRRALPRVTALGGVLLLVGGGLLAVPAAPMAGGLVLGFAGLGAVIVGCALLAPAATAGLMRLLRPPLGMLLGARGRMAAGGVAASLSRTAVAIAALMVAVSVTVGIGVMIDSFRRTVVAWLERSLQADLYVSAPAGYGGFGGAPIPPGLAARAAAVPGVAAVHPVRRVELRTASGPIQLLAVDDDRRRFRGFELREGDAGDVWRRVAAGGEAIVSEPFSRRRGVHRGGLLRLPTAAGDRTFRVAGVFDDYSSDLGLVLISRRTYLRCWRDPWLSGFSIDLAPEARGDPRTIQLLRQALDEQSAPPTMPPPPGGAAAGPRREPQPPPGGAAAGPRREPQPPPGGATAGPLAIRSNRALKRLSLEIFDRTFLITGVLRLLAGLVAALGVLSALTALQLERAREIGVLRAIGLTPGQVWQLVTTQTGLMGLAAGLLSLPVGLVLSAIMVYIINRRSFGWTIHLEVAPALLLEALALALGTALAAGLVPAWRMARTSPALALREE
jgi:putative ABC transport system permease protein